MKFVPVVATLAFLACGGCSIALDESSGVYASQPGKYDFLDCASLLRTVEKQAEREAELTSLMDRSAKESSGAVVNALVYRDQLNLARADRVAAQKAADEKRCAPELRPQNQGARSLY